MVTECGAGNVRGEQEGMEEQGDWEWEKARVRAERPEGRQEHRADAGDQLHRRSVLLGTRSRPAMAGSHRATSGRVCPQSHVCGSCVVSQPEPPGKVGASSLTTQHTAHASREVSSLSFSDHEALRAEACVGDTASWGRGPSARACGLVR